MALGLIFNPPQHVQKKVVNREIRTRREESHKIIESLDSSKKDFYKLFLKSYNGLFEFVSNQLDIDNFDIFNTEVCESPSFVELEPYDDQTLANYINLYRFNDVRYLNKYILKVHEKLKMGGIFIARAETLDIRKPKLFQQHAKPVAQLLHIVHFLYARVMAKLPLLNKLYYFLSKGKNRALSIAEVMGRLYFCGFKIVDLKKTKDDFFFIAQKVKEAVKDVKPSYGMVIKLKRVGRDGKSVYIRKLRTMHPYSEFLQEYIYEQNKLHSNGKFKDDFRVTGWGRLLRKYWIDEIPQIINFIKGEIKLVGVRAISEHYFSLYPKDLQKLRTQFKPGLIPPYYVHMPKTFDEIVESEKTYFAEKLKGHFVDNIYFFRAMYNILFRSARSL